MILDIKIFQILPNQKKCFGNYSVKRLMHTLDVEIYTYENSLSDAIMKFAYAKFLVLRIICKYIIVIYVLVGLFFLLRY